MSDELSVSQKLEKLRLLEQREKLRTGLPHLYGLPRYEWGERFRASRNRITLLCAANQIGKSTEQIRKCLEWATSPQLWTELWQTRPIQFWYLYPSRDVATIEFETKWMPLMPQGEWKEHPVFGWEAEYREGSIYAIYFNSGVRLYFKTYAQNKKTLQSGSVSAIWCDEELIEDLFDELMFRLAATGGYFHMVFTATLGQQLWWDAMEGTGEREKFPDAHKQQVSMYDCLTYADGSPSPWTKEKIKQIELSCKSENEIRRRVHGGFVKDEGLKYPTYSPQKHFKPYHPVPPSWRIYPGIDMGGGGDGHPAGIVFLAVDPLYQKGRVILSWRGDKQLTTAADVVNKFIEMRGQTEVMPPRYDFAAKDLGIIAGRMGLAFLTAEKSHEKGEQILNTLFKHNMLQIYDNSDNHKLSVELLNLRSGGPKTKAKDDLVDPLRYAAVSVPWDFSVLGEDAPVKEIKEQETEVDLRRKPFLSQEDESFSVEDELDAWNEMYGAD